jgi:hypothetical protein
VSTAGQWDFTVPDDDADLLAELRRHGVAPGQRWHLNLLGEGDPPAGPDEFDTLMSGYVGSFDSGDPTLARRAKEIARSELGAL